MPTSQLSPPSAGPEWKEEMLAGGEGLSIKAWETGLNGPMWGGAQTEEQDEESVADGPTRIRTQPNTPFGQIKNFRYDGIPLATAPYETIAHTGLSLMEHFSEMEQRLSHSVPATPFSTEATTAQDSDEVHIAPPFATVVLNGVVIIQVLLPMEGDSPISKNQPLPSLRLPGSSGDIEVQAVGVLPVIFISEHLSWSLKVALTRGDKSHVFTLDDLNKANSDVLVDGIISFEPTEVTVTATLVRKKGTTQVDPLEMEFVDAIKSVFYDPEINPRGGSLQISTVQNYAKTKVPDLYDKVVRIGESGDLAAVIRRHPDAFLLFKFSDKEIESRGLDSCGPHELRIALTLHEKQGCKAIDTQKESKQRETEQELLKAMEELLHERDYDQRELLEKLAVNPSYLFFLSPSFSTLMRFLSKHKDKFAWTTHPDKPTSIGLVGMLDRDTPAKKDADRSHQKTPQRLAASAAPTTLPPTTATPAVSEGQPWIMLQHNMQNAHVPQQGMTAQQQLQPTAVPLQQPQIPSARFMLPGQMQPFQLGMPKNMTQTAQPNMQGMQGMQSMQGVQGMQSMQGVQGMQSMQGMQGMQSMQGVQGMQQGWPSPTAIPNQQMLLMQQLAQMQHGTFSQPLPSPNSGMMIGQPTMPQMRPQINIASAVPQPIMQQTMQTHTTTPIQFAMPNTVMLGQHHHGQVSSPATQLYMPLLS